MLLWVKRENQHGTRTEKPGGCGVTLSSEDILLEAPESDDAYFKRFKRRKKNRRVRKKKTKEKRERTGKLLLGASPR
jgi:hypothetical protein